MSHAVNAKGLDLRALGTKLGELVQAGPVTISHAEHLHGMCAGLGSGEITIEGDSGDYLGVLNDGATLHLKGNAGNYVADNMTRGTVVVEGNAGLGVGAYCYGGTIVVKGDAGDFAAVMNKGATIVVNGDVGDEVATYMLAGDLIILGHAGKNLGNFLIRGNIYVAGGWETLGHNTLLADMTPADIAKLKALLAEHGLGAKVDPAAFKKIVRLSEKPFYKAKKPAQLEPARA